MLAVVNRSTRTGQIIRSLLDETIHQFEDKLIFVLETNDFATVLDVSLHCLKIALSTYESLPGIVREFNSNSRSTDMITHYSTIPVFSM